MTKMLATLLLGFFLAPTAHADALRGYVEKKSGVKYLQLQSDAGPDQLLPVTTQNAQVQTSLDKLKEGDFIVARGAVATDGLTVQIESIESLGLQALVGTWATQRLEVYEFRDFSQLNLYLPTQPAQSGMKAPQIVKAGEFHYAVTPDQGARYSIF